MHLEYMFYPVDGSACSDHLENVSMDSLCPADGEDGNRPKKSRRLEVDTNRPKEAECNVDSKDPENEDSGEGCNTNDMIPDLSVSGSIPASMIEQVLEVLGTEISLKSKSRRIMEGMGCESKPRRWLNLKSMFVKGCNLYEMFDGIPSFKEYGPDISGSMWVPVEMIEKTFAYMKRSTKN